MEGPEKILIYYEPPRVVILAHGSLDFWKNALMINTILLLNWIDNMLGPTIHFSLLVALLCLFFLMVKYLEIFMNAVARILFS